jgi:peroxiredoxin Q/BCP
MNKLNKGDMAPDFSLKDQNGTMVRLSDFKGRKVLLFFYPKALTSGCTVQAKEVSAARKLLAQKGAEAIGISTDLPDLLKKFDNRHELNFALLSDADHRVSELYGVWAEKNMYGKVFYGIVRSAFLIDEDSRILQTW